MQEEQEDNTKVVDELKDQLKVLMEQLNLRDKQIQEQADDVSEMRNRH